MHFFCTQKVSYNIIFLSFSIKIFKVMILGVFKSGLSLCQYKSIMFAIICKISICNTKKKKTTFAAVASTKPK